MEYVLPFVLGLLLGMTFRGQIKIGLININKGE